MKDKRASIIVNIKNILTIISLFVGMIVAYETWQEKQEQEIQALLELAETYYWEENYEGVAAVYSDERLREHPLVLLNIGVMYANGIYYMPDTEQAIRYFEAALENGEKNYSIVYLMQLLSHEDLERIKQIVELGCSYNSKYCERLLQDLYLEAGITCEGGYLQDFAKRTDDERQEILSHLFIMVDKLTFRLANEYVYTADITVTGDQKTYSNVRAQAVDVEERVVEVFVKNYFGRSDIVMVFE